MRRIALQVGRVLEVLFAGFFFFIFMLVAGDKAWRFLLSEEEERFAIA
jgi:hypothetical protein